MTDTLMLRSAADGWYRVESEKKPAQYVCEVVVAGNQLEAPSGSRASITAEAWAIQGKLFPTLLVEAPEYYTRPEDYAEPSDNDLVFYSSERDDD